MNDGEKNEKLRIIPALLTSDRRVIRLDLYRRNDPQCLLVIDQAFQLHFEIPTAIMNDETCSLTNKNALAYSDGQINTEELTIRVLISRIESHIRELYYTDDDAVYKVLALFIFATYLYQLFGEMPYLYLNGEKGAGKSLLCKILSLFCFCPKFIVGSSEAALFRSISIEGGTFILDEMENIGSREKANDSLMAAILKAGYSEDGGVTQRYNTETSSIDRFKLYSPKVIANIFGIDDVIEDRCIKIPVKKYNPKFTESKRSVKEFEEKNKEQIKQLTSYCCLSALMNFETIYEEFMKSEFTSVTSRASQILKPILVLAKLAGQDYKSAFFSYYNKNIVAEKGWTDVTTPEGILKEALKQAAKEIQNGKFELLIEENYIEPGYFTKIDNKSFRINTFAIKLVMDIFDGKRNYSMQDVHKLLKRVYSGIILESENRTTVSFRLKDDLVKRMNNKSSIGTYILDFKFDDILKTEVEVQNNEELECFTESEIEEKRIASEIIASGDHEKILNSELVQKYYF